MASTRFVEGLEERERRRRRLADHEIGRLRALGELEADALVPLLRDDGLGEVERAGRGRTRVALVVAAEGADVLRPGLPPGVLLLRLDHAERRLALPREDEHVVALHAEVAREVEDVVRRPHHERVEARARP